MAKPSCANSVRSCNAADSSQRLNLRDPVDLRSRGFLRSATLLGEKIPSSSAYPFNLPAVRALETLEFHPAVTFIVGENGSGKSTLIEALAVCAGFNAEGGSRNFNFATRASHSNLHGALRLARSHRRPRTGFFCAQNLFLTSRLRSNAWTDTPLPSRISRSRP